MIANPLRARSIGSIGTDFAVHEIQDDAPPSGGGRGGIPLHSHRKEDEAWYVLEGTLRFVHGEREFDATSGSGVLLPHGAPHTFWNPGPGGARYLLIVGPKTEGLLELLHGPRRPDPKDRRAAYASFDIDLLE
ncbi:MAG: cupin domain-containing protein [Thermoplasmata archaeon]